MDALIISNALDTNGGNFRLSRAAEKWGSAPNVVKALAIGDYDPASVVGRFQAAAEKSDALRIRSVHRATHIYQQMPADILWTNANRQQIKQMADAADLIHLNNSTMAARRLHIRDKPFLVHHHGSLFRNNPQHQLAEARQFRALQAVSTVDLMRVAPERLHWLPTAYDIDWLQEFGKAHRDELRDSGKLRIVQAPTDGKDSPYKSTPALRKAVAGLAAQGLDVELIVVENKPWAECMAIKATADIYFDQVKLGYGCNAVEAWGMGIPVIAGADDWTLAKMAEVYGKKTLPFYRATEESIADAIVALSDAKTRATYAKRGMAHVRKFHDELPALTRLAELYAKVLSQPAEDRALDKIPPVTFTATNVQQVRVGRFITLPYTTDNPYVASRIRAIALRHRNYGIEEIADAG